MPTISMFYGILVAMHNNRGQTTVSEVVGVLDAKMVGMNVMLVGRISV